jgi:hypothetical protein
VSLIVVLQLNYIYVNCFCAQKAVQTTQYDREREDPNSSLLKMLQQILAVQKTNKVTNLMISVL